MAGFLTYWHTLKHLRPVQITSRALRLLPKKMPVRGALPLAVPRGTWVEPARTPTRMTGPRRFDFLGHERELPENSWNCDGTDLLWQYNLHYFDDLNAGDGERRQLWHRELIADWIDTNVPVSNPGWASYPSSLRIVNWAKWHFDRSQLDKTALESMAMQTRWLDRNLEWHLLGNHLFANAKALVFAGCFFEGNEADRWLSRGSRILENELSEQVLGDGGNFELSPMYHSIFLADCLDLTNLARLYPSRMSATLTSKLEKTSASMLDWLECLSHPDGEIAQFNDAAIGIAPEPRQLRDYALRLDIAESGGTCSADRGTGSKPEGHLLPSSGYARLTTPEAVIMCDVARIGPDYLPGHAHADTLSFEMSIRGRRFVVNGGTSRYGVSPERLAERSTSAHSTVAINRTNSSEVWGGFRVARRARPLDVNLREDADSVQLSAAHDGYQRIHKDILHRRSWTLGRRILRVEDIAEGPVLCAHARFLLHHLVDVQQSDEDCWVLSHQSEPDLKVLLRVAEGKAHAIAATHSPRFGQVEDTTAIQVSLVDGRSVIELEWA